MKQTVAILSLLFSCVIIASPVHAQKDTLRVMAYNVLYYGNGCQGPTANYHEYLRTIVSYTHPDILSMEKMASIQVSKEDKYGTAPMGFADSIIRYALDPAFAGRYAHCPFTNNAHGNNMAVIFYDQHKLGFLSIVSSYVNITDFNVYKFYYKDVDLAKTNDTTFLYVIPNHDLSGDEHEQARGLQIAGVMKNIKQHFTHLPNVINMGDFNARNSNEPFYKELTTTTDTGFRFFDPPFFPDKKLSYPANWDHEGGYAAYFTTSTRESATIPNACGTGGGAKNWYDHIFLSSWIINNTNHIRYIPNSYRTVGNDGQRLQISINNKNSHINTSAPADVIEALYQMSNKYPVMVDLEVTKSGTGKRMPNPEIAGAKDRVIPPVTASVDNQSVKISFPPDVEGQDMKITITDGNGVSETQKKKRVKDGLIELSNKLKPGNYTLTVVGHHNVLAELKVTVK